MSVDRLCEVCGVDAEGLNVWNLDRRRVCHACARALIEVLASYLHLSSLSGSAYGAEVQYGQIDELLVRMGPDEAAFLVQGGLGLSDAERDLLIARYGPHRVE